MSTTEYPNSTVAASAGREQQPSILSTVQWISACLSVSDLDVSADWYIDKLGFETVLRQDFPALSARLAYLRHRDLVLELVESTPSAGIVRPAPPLHGLVRGISQITFYVPDIREAFAGVRAQGLPIVMDLVEVPQIGVSAFFTEDPDGNLIEFHQAAWAAGDPA
jgi:catechol 2,3-dioxygenase-like lactoylglutathione lyase family enzyme